MLKPAKIKKKKTVCCIHLLTLISQTESRDAVFTLLEIRASGPSPLSATEQVFLPETLEPKAEFWTLWDLLFRL